MYVGTANVHAFPVVAVEVTWEVGALGVVELSFVIHTCTLDFILAFAVVCALFADVCALSAED